MKKAALYLRVSTKDQSTENQRLELIRVANAKGWHIVEVYEDLAISGTKGRDRRPAYDRMLKEAVRAKFQVVLAWDVSRLGRSLINLVSAIDDLHANGIDLYLHQQAIDTTTPSGMALFQMCGVFAEFERGMISERVKAGLQRARGQGVRLGRPEVSYDPNQLARMVQAGKSVRQVALSLGVSVGKAQTLLRNSRS